MLVELNPLRALTEPAEYGDTRVPVRRRNRRHPPGRSSTAPWTSPTRSCSAASCARSNGTGRRARPSRRFRSSALVVSVEPRSSVGSDPRRRTASAVCAGLKLSSRMSSAFRARTSSSCSSESTSTSHGRSGAAARAAVRAADTEPAAATWLSLIRTASPRPSRWFIPPPHRTAYFSSSRSPGRVLRVSRMTAPVPSTASTQRRVAVATPERWQSRLSAVRSAVSRPRTGARTTSAGSPGTSREPSGNAESTSNPGTTSSRTRRATGAPASTPAARGENSPTATASAGTVAAVVASGP
jgi:hypothetical protein